MASGTITMTATATVIVMKISDGEMGTTEDTPAKTESGVNTNGVNVSTGSMSGVNTGAGIGTIDRDTIQTVTFTFSTGAKER